VNAIASFVGVTDPARIAHALGQIATNRNQYQRRRDIVREAREGAPKGAPKGAPRTNQG
jgi:hypothetical protein